MQYFIRLTTDRKLEVSKKNFTSITRLLNNDAARGILLDSGLMLRMSAVDYAWPEMTEDEIKAKEDKEIAEIAALKIKREEEATATKAAELANKRAPRITPKKVPSPKK